MSIGFRIFLYVVGAAVAGVFVYALSEYERRKDKARERTAELEKQLAQAREEIAAMRKHRDAVAKERRYRTIAVEQLTAEEWAYVSGAPLSFEQLVSYKAMRLQREAESEED